MQRTKPAKERRPTAILTADWHLREDQPICRTDNFWETQWKKLEFVKNLCFEHNCPIIFSGDLFNHWKPSPLLLTNTLKHLPLRFYMIYGNHDLPQWNIKLSYKTGVQTLLQGNAITIIDTDELDVEWRMETDMILYFVQAHWGEIPKINPSINYEQKKSSILVWHVMTFPKGKPPWPGCKDITAEEILDKYPQFDLIVTGHHHKTFVVERNGRLLVNPGSLTRQTADQADHHPCIFLWYADDNTVEKVIVPHQEDVISREHIDKIQERDERIQRFVSQLSAEYEVGLTFEENLERFQKENNTTTQVMQIIRRAIE